MESQVKLLYNENIKERKADFMEKNNSKIETIAAVVFLVVGILTVLEYVFVQGLFTAPLMIGLSVIVGLVNIAVAIMKRKYMNMLFYILLTIALNMGYAML